MKMDDDFQNYLVGGAIFDGDADIPCMLRLNDLIIPKSLSPYSARKRISNKNVYLHCFIHDFQFSNLITEIHDAYYNAKETELKNEIEEIEKFLENKNATQISNDLCNKSMQLLRSVLFSKYGNKI